MRGKFFDLHIVEFDKLYRKVPFSTVADWLQSGRLLEEDKVSPAGAETWQPLQKAPEFTPYLPKPDALRTDDVAEALDAVQLDFSWKRSADEEDDDVDMIPLIDISLVLLIFFMMTAGSLFSAALIRTPEAEFGKVIEAAETLAVGMTMTDGRIEYFLDQSQEPLGEAQLLAAVAERMKAGDGEVLLRANPEIPFEQVQQLTIRLQQRGVKRVLPGVVEKKVREETP